MRASPLLGMLAALAIAGGAAPASAGAAACERTGAPPGWAPDVAAARAYGAARSHDLVSFSVRAGGRGWHHRPDEGVPSASVAKAVLLVAELHRLRARPLPPRHRAQMAAMVRRSDDVAATRVRDRVGDAAFAAAARRAGMRRFRVHPVWGRSTLTARDGSRLMAGIWRALPARHRAFGMELLRTVVPQQRWGVGRAAPPGWRLHLKGGWGSGTGAVDHQVALLSRRCLRVALAVLTTGAPSHAYGKATLRGVAARLLRGL